MLDKLCSFLSNFSDFEPYIITKWYHIFTFPITLILLMIETRLHKCLIMVQLDNYIIVQYPVKILNNLYKIRNIFTFNVVFNIYAVMYAINISFIIPTYIAK